MDTKTCHKKKKNKIKEYQKKRYQQLVQYKKEALSNETFCFFLSVIRMSGKTLKY